MIQKNSFSKQTCQPAFITSFEQGLLTYLGLKEVLLDRGVTRMDPISPPDEDSTFADLLAWQVYHLVHNLGNVDGQSFVFG